jgi:hypothetical protein
MTTTLKQNEVQSTANNLLESQGQVDVQVFGEKVGIFVRLFGCGHQNLSRPFSHKTIAYRTCLQCGARKQFNTQTLETVGGFYNPPRARVDALSLA